MPNKFTDLFKEADDSFNSQYADELNELKGLSASELASIEPGTTGQEAYKKLIDVVEQASKENLTQAELVTNIKELGNTAVSIAKKVTGIAKLL